MEESNARAKAEDTLQLSNRVIENSPAVLFRWDADKGWPVLFVSENISQFGYSAEEFMNNNTPYETIMHPEDLEAVEIGVDKSIAKGSNTFNQESGHRRKQVLFFSSRLGQISNILGAAL